MHTAARVYVHVHRLTHEELEHAPPVRVHVHVHRLTPEELEHAPPRACARGMCIA